MIVTLKFRKNKGVTNITCRENIALDVNKKLNRMRMQGKIGEKHTITADTIEGWIEESCFNRGYLHTSDKIRKDYWKFLERLYTTIMSRYIRKDTFIEDTDEVDEKIDSSYYFPGLVWLIGKGWIIVNSDDLVTKYKEERQNSLEGQKKHLGQKCLDCYNFVELLPDKYKHPELNEHVEIA